VKNFTNTLLHYGRAVQAIALLLLLHPGFVFSQATLHMFDPGEVPINSTHQFVLSDQDNVTQFYHWYWKIQGCAETTQWEYSLTSPNNYSALKQGVYGYWQNVSDLYNYAEASGTWEMKINDPGSVCNDIVRPIFEITTVRQADSSLPVTGNHIAALTPVEDTIRNWLIANNFEAATFALAYDGRLVYRKGIGWNDRDRTTEIDPSAIMRLASNTKPITRTAIEILMTEYGLSPSTKVWDILKDVHPPFVAESQIDQQHKTYTIQNLIDHTSGLQSYPTYSGQLARNLGQSEPASFSQMISNMWESSLGTLGEESYSNYGYQLLAAIIEKYSAMSYNQYINEKIAQPLGLTTLKGAKNTIEQAYPNEIWYAGRYVDQPFYRVDISYDPRNPTHNTRVEEPYCLDLERTPGSGSLVSSAEDLVKFYANYYHDGSVKNSASYNTGWNYLFYGSWPGTWTMSRDIVTNIGNHGSHNISYVLLVNERVPNGDLDPIFKGISQIADSLGPTDIPDIDLFENGLEQQAHVDFGSVSTTMEKIISIPITNIYGSDLPIHSISVPSGYNQVNTFTEIAAGQTQDLQLGFSPTAAQSYAGEVEISHGDGLSMSFSVSGTGFSNSGISIPGRIEAEDYNNGGEGVGYHDATAGNSGGKYRSDDVDIGIASDVGGGYNVGWVEAGEWLEYTVSVDTTASYTISVRMASAVSGSKTVKVLVNGIEKSTHTLTQTTGWQDWVNVSQSNVNLSAGTHILRLAMQSSSVNINYIDISLETGGTGTCPGTTELDANQATGSNGSLAWWGIAMDPGDFVYHENVNFGTGGFDSIRVRGCSGDANAKIELRLNSPTGQLLATINTYDGSWWPAGFPDTYYQQKHALSNFPTGQHDLYIVGSGAITNYAGIELSCGSSGGGVTTPGLVYYNDTQPVTSTNGNNVSITEVTSTSYEGNKSYKMAFNFSNTWWAEGRLNRVVDVSGKDSLTFWYKMTSSSLPGQVKVEPVDNDWNNGAIVLNETTVWSYFSTPLSSFSGFTPSELTRLRITRQGTASSTDAFFIDDVQFK